jgi:glycine/sarcosine/betaine reductase selenoprotein B
MTTSHGPGTTAAVAVQDDEPIPYMQRTRDYYVALGYGNPYRWAHFAEVPFAPLRVPLGRARLGLITTAAPYQPEAGDQGPGAPYNAGAKFYRVYSAPTDSIPDLRISHVGYDRRHTSAADLNTYFPLARLREAAASGRFGELAPRFHGAPTNRSYRVTTESDAPELLRRCQEDAVDGVVLVPT